MARKKNPEETKSLILDKSLQLFIEKGYEHTSIQDILNTLGGLSKGAIYYHFKSKEDIFKGVCDRLAEQRYVYYKDIIDDSSRSGKEKLKFTLQSSYQSNMNAEMFFISEQLMRDDRFFKQSILEMYYSIAKDYIEPIIHQGIEDGTISTKYPKEVSEVLITLINIWLSPFIKPMSNQEIKNKLEFFDILLKNIGLDIIDAETVKGFLSFNEAYNKFRNRK